jgi:hypothetical protein
VAKLQFRVTSPHRKPLFERGSAAPACKIAKRAGHEAAESMETSVVQGLVRRWVSGIMAWFLQ